MLRRLLGPLAARWSWVETAIRVQERFSELRGGYLASAITLAAFLSLFPLLLLATAVVGSFSLRYDLAGRVISELGLSGDAANAVRTAVATAAKGRGIAGPIGAIGLLWSGLGMVAAIEYAFDEVWQVSGRGWRDKLRGLLWLGGATVVFVVSFGLSAVLQLSPWAGWFTIPLALLVNVALWTWTLKQLTGVHLPWRAHVAGAVLGAIGFEAL